MLKLTLAALTLASVAYADPAPPAPDFSGRVPAQRVDRKFAASDGDSTIAPLAEVVFAPNSSALGPDAILQVDQAVKWLRAHSSYRIVLEANAAGSVPDIAEDLANRRASMVRNHLMSWGISGDRVVILVGHDRTANLTMFASDRPVRQIVTAALDHRGDTAAVWTDRGTLFQEEQGLGQPRHEAVATRK